MSIPKSPLDKELSALDARRVRFVRPELVAEVGFRAWTAEGLIRHASFRGLREDKRLGNIVAGPLSGGAITYLCLNSLPAGPKTSHIEVEVVGVGCIVVRPKHDVEGPAGTLVNVS